MSERHRTSTLSTLRARGRHALPWLRRNPANRWKVLLAPAILGAALFAYPAFAGTNFYVATTGSDANDCTSAGTPCLTIKAAIAKAGTGDTVIVAAGTYNEDAIVISKALTLQGAGAATTSIDKSADPAGVTIIDIKDITSGEVVVEGFTIRTGAATSNPSSNLFQNGIGVYNISNGVTVKIRNNRIYGNPSLTKYSAVSPATYYDNFGISANNGPGGTSAALEVTGNTLYGGNSHTMLIELWRGPVLVSGNVIHRPVQDTSNSTVIVDMNYGGVDVTGAHRFENNTFEFGANPSATRRMDVLTVVSAFDNYDGDGLVGVNGAGGFADVRILNNQIQGLVANSRGIILWDSTNAADSAITATITGNTFSGVSSNFGIRLTGPDVTSTIRNNNFAGGVLAPPATDTGVAKAILAFPFSSLNGPKASLTDVEDNNLGASSLGIDWASGQGTLDASNNYWGTAAGPAGKTSGSVTTAPWIATSTPDPAKSGSPGFWPTSVVYTSPCTTTCYVATTGSDSNSGTAAYPFLTVSKAVSSVSSGGTVSIGAGTFAAVDIHLTQAVTLDGAGAASTVLTGAGSATSALWIEASNITIQELAIKNSPAAAVRFDKSGSTLSNTLFQDIEIANNTSYAIAVHNGTTVDGVTIRRATVSNNATGFRTATTGIGKNILIEDSTFSNPTSGPNFHQNAVTSGSANATNGYVDGLTIRGSSFTSSAPATIANIYGEELRNVLIENNTFSGQVRGVYLYNVYAASTNLNGDIIVRNNTFTDLRFPAVVLFNSQLLDRPVTIDGNTITHTVNLNDAAWGLAIDVRLYPSLAHAAVTISNNRVSMRSTLAPGAVPDAGYGAPANFAVALRGDYNGVKIFGNTFDGGGVSGAGNVGGLGTYPAGAGVYIRTSDATFGSPSASSTLDIRNNRITGFVDGVTVYDRVATAYGGLPSGNAVTITKNSLVGNSGNGVRNGDPAQAVSATGNWWGCAAGPGNSGCDAVTANVTATSFLTSSSSAPLSPGFWPIDAPATTVTEPLTTTSDAPPIAAAVDLGGGASTSLVLDFGAITGAGDVVVTKSDTPSDGSVSFGGNAVINISFDGDFTPPVKVCLGYDDSMFPDGSTPALWHYEETSPGSGVYAWVALETVTLDTVNKVICALTDSFSDFAPGIEATDACENSGGVLTVTIPDGLDVTVARSTNTLTVIFDAGTECLASPATIGSNSGAGQIRTLALVGGSGNETVTFAIATPTNWGANSTSSLARTIDLGAGSGDVVILQGTGFADTITASAIAGVYTGVESLQLEGLGGADTLTAGSTPDVLSGGAGIDILKGGDGNDTFYGGDDNDSLQGGAGTDCADYSAETAPLTVNLTAGTITGGTAVDADTATSMECVKGGSGNDSFSGSAYGDTFYGNGGNDTLQGRGGPDTLNGGAGTGDTVTYAEQTYAVVVNLTTGTATGATVGTGGDTIVAGTVENVIGGSAGDTLVGDSATNSLSGGGGNDTLVGMDGNDTLNGDTGVDTVSYDDTNFGTGAASTSVIADLATGEASAAAGNDALATVENLTGSTYGDTLTGNSAVNILNGLGGADTVNAGGGNDTVNGGAGGDTLNGEAGADTIRGGDEADTINGGADADAIWGDAGGDTLLGGAAGDTLRGGAGNDILVGGSGTGVDVMYGDADTDTISYDSDTYTAGAYGNAASTGYVVFKLSSVGIQQATNGAGTDVAGDLIENLTGTSGNDSLIGNSLANVISGLGGADVLQGGDGNDFLYAGEGTGNKAEGQAGTDTCTVSGAGTWVYLWPKTCEP